MDLDEVDEAYVASLMPEGAIPTGLVSVVTWLSPETGASCWRVHCDVDTRVIETIGALELAKLDVIARSGTGLPINYPEGDPRRHPETPEE